MPMQKTTIDDSGRAATAINGKRSRWGHPAASSEGYRMSDATSVANRQYGRAVKKPLRNFNAFY